MDVPSGSPPPGDNLPYFHTAVGTDSGPPVLQHISGDLSDPRSIDMFGLESALGEDLDVDALQTKLPTSDTVAAHEALKWETQRVWLGTQLGWTSVRWTVVSVEPAVYQVPRKYSMISAVRRDAIVYSPVLVHRRLMANHNRRGWNL